MKSPVCPFVVLFLLLSAVVKSRGPSDGNGYVVIYPFFWPLFMLSSGFERLRSGKIQITNLPLLVPLLIFTPAEAFSNPRRQGLIFSSAPLWPPVVIVPPL